MTLEEANQALRNIGCPVTIEQPAIHSAFLEVILWLHERILTLEEANHEQH